MSIFVALKKLFFHFLNFLILNQINHATKAMTDNPIPKVTYIIESLARLYLEIISLHRSSVISYRSHYSGSVIPFSKSKQQPVSGVGSAA